MSLLKNVVDFKMTFWRSNVARYDLCVPGTFRLVPPENSVPLIKRDYELMQNMIFGKAPSYDELISGIAQLEMEINNVNYTLG